MSVDADVKKFGEIIDQIDDHVKQAYDLILLRTDFFPLWAKEDVQAKIGEENHKLLEQIVEHIRQAQTLLFQFSTVPRASVNIEES